MAEIDADKDIKQQAEALTQTVGTTDASPQKDIHKTVGGRITDFFIYYVLGFFANSGLSLGFTYWLNPQPGVKKMKDGITEAITSKMKSANPVKTREGVRSTVEIGFMMVSGFFVTAIMTPLVSRRDKIAYKINQWLGKDKDVLPDDMKPLPVPKTLEERIEQEINRRVNKKQSAWDLWKARFLGMGLVQAGNMIHNHVSTSLEGSAANTQYPEKQTLRVLSWRGGQKLYKWLPQKMLKSWIGFFDKHEASIGDMKMNMGEHYQRLEKVEQKYGGGAINEDRMVVAEQTRIVAKEVGWTLIMAGVVEKTTHWFHNRRVKHQREKAIAELKREGVIPQGYDVVVDEEVRLSKKPESNASWAGKGGQPRDVTKSANYAQAVENSRIGSEQTAGI